MVVQTNTLVNLLCLFAKLLVSLSLSVCFLLICGRPASREPGELRMAESEFLGSPPVGLGIPPPKVKHLLESKPNIQILSLWIGCIPDLFLCPAWHMRSTYRHAMHRQTLQQHDSVQHDTTRQDATRRDAILRKYNDKVDREHRRSRPCSRHGRKRALPRWRDFPLVLRDFPLSRDFPLVLRDFPYRHASEDPREDAALRYAVIQCPRNG